tara:strand:- start:17673 stop:18854 length:1182 start_codon:yes stop_codon:yes gene_type:complete
MVNLNHGAAIVGIHEHQTRYAPDKSELQIQGESVIKALEDAGLTKNDVEGLFTASSTIRNSGLNLADYLDMYPKYVDNTTVGGGSFEFHLSHALTAIAAGRIKCAVITYSSLAKSGGISVGTGGVARFGHPRLDPSPDSFEEIYGLTTVGLYAMIARRHMELYGTTSEQLAEVAVAMRRHAGLNPEAQFRDPITVSDVVNSRVISDPLHLPDCCVITDGGGAVVIASPELAKNCKQTPVWILGVGEALAHQGAGKRDLMYIAAKQSHGPAFEMAGVKHSDIDMAMVYDSFTITVIETLEDLGFCEKGEGGHFVSNGRIQLGGELPLNTDGGGLSSNHPGMRGIFLLLEATRQLRHQFEGTERQVPNCNIALCHGTGGALGSRHSGGTVILGRD